MPIWNNVAGVWKSISLRHNVSSTWKTIVGWLNVAGVWKNISPVAIYTPPAGNYYDFGLDETAFITINVNTPVTWTWSKTGHAAGSSNVASGGVASSITFSLAAGAVTGTRTCQFLATGTIGTQVDNFTIDLEAERT